jgi:hypothetical protein
MGSRRCYNCTQLLDELDWANIVDKTDGETLLAVDLCTKCSTRQYYADKPRKIYPLKYASASLTLEIDGVNDRPLMNTATLTVITGRGEEHSQFISCSNLLRSMFRFCDPIQEGRIGMHHSAGAVIFLDEDGECFGSASDYDILKLLTDGGKIEIAM